MRLTANFSLDEFTRSQTATRLGISNQPNEEHRAAIKALCEKVLQPLRDRLGRSITITSGYRSPTLNARIGGSNNSQHSLGQAADFVVAGLTPLEVCRFIADSDLPFDQLIWEGTWTHISHGPRNRRQILTAHFAQNGRVTYSNGLPA